MSDYPSGICRYCGCTEAKSCHIYSGGEYDDCGWLYGTKQTVCSNPHCISNYARDQRAHQAYVKELNRKRAPWEIEELIQKERKERRRASRLRFKARKAEKAANSG